jgi:hypothetical protein
LTLHGAATATDPKGGRPVLPSQSRHRPLGLNEVALRSGFWSRLQAANATATMRHCEEWMERLGWLANFDRAAAGTTDAQRPGWSFSDSEVYKLIEALSWEYGASGRPELDEAVRRLTRRIAPAQDEDGYLNTYYGHPGRPPRYSDLEMGHELYCVGHLLQAAVARLRTVGEDELVGVARRAADHVCEVFGAEGEPGLCGHPEIEVGLAEFGRALAEPRYIAQAALFLQRRGHGSLREHRAPTGSAYFQDDMPVREAEVWRGHAVRALYLAAAAVDVAVEQQDAGLLGAVERQWDHTVARRTYITGGMGSRHQDEGFGEDWELPPDRAYCESCAGIASIMVSWRLYLATGQVRYADLIERTLFNVVATSPGPDGRTFFYANPLQQRVAGGAVNTETVNPRAESGVRAPWFDVSCCPTNLARTLATWQSYAASTGERDVTLLQYAGLSIDTFDDEHPRQTRLVYALDADRGQAWWLSADPDPAPWTDRYVDTERMEDDRFPDSPSLSLASSYYSGPASVAKIERPDVTVRRSERNGETRELRLRITPAEASRLSLYADTRSHTVTAATVDGINVEEAPGQRQDTDPSKWGFVFHGGPPEGIDVTLEVRGEGPLPLRIIAYRDGLPRVPELTPRPDNLTWSGTSSNLTMVAKSYRV